MIELVNITAWGTELTLHHGGGQRSTARSVFDLYTKRSDSTFEQHTFRSSAQRRDFEHELTSRGIVPFEADVSPTRRWLIEHQGEYKIIRPNSVYLDLETDSRLAIRQHVSGEARILCWAIVGKDDGKIQSGMLESDSDADEAKMLLNLWRALKPYDSVIAWNGGEVTWRILKDQGDSSKQGYDFLVLIRRSAKLGVLPKGYDRLLYLDHMVLFKKYNVNSGERSEKISYSLQSIGQAKVGRGKQEFDSRHTWDAWVSGGQQRSNLMEYNIADALLEADVEKATDYIPVFESVCELTSNFPDSGSLQPSRIVDGMVLAYGARRGIRFPTKPYGVGESKDKGFSGAIVTGPFVKGIERDIHVSDYAALYPSVILSLNISPETLGGQGSTAPVDQESMDKYGVKEPITFRTDVLGVLPECLSDISKLRDEHKRNAKKFPVGSPEEAEASRKSFALKVINNAYFGVITSIYSRYSDVRLGLAITRTGVACIRAAQQAIRDRGWKVVYGDTDSCMVKGPTVDEMREAVAEFNRDTLPRLAKEWGCRECKFRLEYEKAFDKLLFSFDPKEGEPIKKRYVYRLQHKGFTAPKIGSEIGWTGIELKRGDSTKLATDLLERVVKMLMAPETPPPEVFEELLREERLRVLHTKHPLEFVQIAKSISKDPSEYDSETLPHLAVAKILKSRGREVQVGEKVAYVVVCGSQSHPEFNGTQRVIPAEDYDGECDGFYYWESVVFPPTYRILKGAWPNEKRFDSYLAPATAANVRHQRLERAGQLNIGVLGRG